MKCDGCKFAFWDRTKSGGLHPSKRGKCSYVVSIPDIPQAFCWPGHWSSGAPTLSGGYINRGFELHSPCLTREDQ